jgi:hypothetical protein
VEEARAFYFLSSEVLPMAKHPLFNFRMPRQDQDLLKGFAAERGKPAGELAREVLTRWLDQQQIQAEKQKRSA